MTTTERFNGIRAFVQAADAGSFTLAGERLGLSKSAVGKSIAQLEERLGVRLFRRTTRSLSLTDEGQVYYESCVRALTELKDAEALLASRGQAPSGRLRIDLPVVFGRRCVVPVLLGLASRYPELRLDVSFNNRRVDPIEEGFDLVVRIGHLEDSAGLVARRIGVQTMVVCGAPSYLQSRGRPNVVDDLSSHDCIIYNRSGRSNPWLFGGPDGDVRPHLVQGRFQFGSGDVIADAVLSGFGLAQLPTWLISEHLKSGDLEAVLTESSCEGWPIHALWPQVRHLAPKVRVVVDELVNRFVPVPPWDLK